jgi:DNA polymerase I-like protein with 3'-5' exonuclease and polymerase domains
MGNASLRALTGHSSLDKWQCSPLDSIAECPVRKVMPTFSMERIQKQYDLGVWLDLALNKCKKYEGVRVWPRKDYKFYLNPRNEVKFEILDQLKSESRLAVDIETGRGQINTVGFAWSDRHAIAINVLPENYSANTYYEIWKRIADICEGSAEKIMQNGIYEILFFATYGIKLNNFYHDTMWAQKMLWPELNKGLAAVGRIYTMEPFWKDEGKTVASDGGRKDWGNVRDWEGHYRYNCLDTTGTYEAHSNQLRDIESRKMSGLWSGHLMRFQNPLSEMCLRGLPIDDAARCLQRSNLERGIKSLTGSLSEEINPNSPKQKINLFKEKGYKLPKKRNSKGEYKESADELSLKKLRLKYPEDEDLKALLQIGPKQKALSSYINVSYSGKSVHYMLDGCGTETGRWSSSKDHLSEGFNAQTLPKYAKKFVSWPEDEDRIFVQCDLAQAESRFVAYDSADENLITMLEDPTKDIHSYVAAEIFKCSVEQVIEEKNAGDPSKRQLGKKSGHGANYSMGEATFMDSCLKEMDLVLNKKEAKNVLDAYHRLFPGIRQWHSAIRTEVRNTKRLTNPFGRERFFYGRMDDNTFRESYAYRPQSTVPDITNCLMLKLWDARAEGDFDFWFHLQCHDSITVSCREQEKDRIVQFMLDTDKWHPDITLRAGKLVIPTSVEWGKSLGDMTEL